MGRYGKGEGRAMKRYILGIDPGTVQSAFVYWDADQKRIIDKGILPNEDMLHYIINYYKLGSNMDVMVIEGIASFGMPVGKEVFATCIWIGRFWQACQYPVRLLYRREVKMFLCGNMRAKDGNIRQALMDMLEKDACKGVHKDMWSALSICITYAYKAQRETDGEIVKETGI
jgi:Holliday junction resolvasome RuvABC endonuclease subunit